MKKTRALIPPNELWWLVADVDHVDAFSTYPEEHVEKVVDYFYGQLGVR